MDRETYDNMRSTEQYHWWFTVRRQILSDQIERLPRTDSLRILEVGCGTGGNLEMLSAFGHVTAIEPDEPSRSYAAMRSGAEILHGSLPDKLPKFAHQFDLVAAFDVIEHVAEDQNSIHALERMISPGGFLIATVPAYPWLWSSHDEQHHHKRRYMIQNFTALFKKAGLEISRSTYFNTLLFPPIAVVRIGRMITGANGEIDDAAPPGKIVNWLFTTIFSVERLIIRYMNFPFGVSMLIIAHKPK